MRINAGIEPQATDGVPFDGQSAAIRVEVLSQSIPRENIRSLDIWGTGVAAGLFPSRTIGFSKPEAEAATANFATGKASYATAMEAEFPVPGSRNGEFGLSVVVTYLDKSGSLQEASAAMAGDILHTDAGLQATIESDFDTDSRMYAKGQDLCF